MALDCAAVNYVGKNVLVEYSLACGDVDPQALSYLPIGAMRGKTFDMSADTVDTTNDSSSGGFRSSLTTFKNFTFSGDGIAQRDDGVSFTQTALLKHFVESSSPVAWFRFTFPDITIYAFMSISNFSREAPYDDAVSWSLEAAATATGSQYAAVSVVDTPVVPTSITVTPASVAVDVGDTQQLTVVVNPAGAPQTVTYTSAAAGTASVSSTGLVTGVAVGSTTVTVTAAGGTVTKVVPVTVSA